MDVDYAYLNAMLTEPIYMKQLYGYESGDKDEVLLLKKKHFMASTNLEENGISILVVNSTNLGSLQQLQMQLFFYRRKAKGHVIVATAVDDLTITAENQSVLDNTKWDLTQVFSMKDLGEIHWLLNLKIKRDWQKKMITISQPAYIEKLLKKFNLEDVKTYVTPLDPAVKLSNYQCPTTERGKQAMSKIPYRQAIGSLMWAAVATQPDIAFSVSLLSQFLENPGGTHWNAVKHVFKYLKGTKHCKLTLGRNRDGLVGYSDADWGSQNHRRSYSAYIYQFYGETVSWSFQK
jgi:Reverse transcriptase (RNA-dependent DNA polymerase)